MPRVCYVYCFYRRVCQMVFRPWSQEMSAKWCKCIGEIYVNMSLVESTWRPRSSKETLQIKSRYLSKRDSSVYVCSFYYNHISVTILRLKMGRAAVVQLRSLKKKFLFSSHPLMYGIHSINIKGFSSNLTQNSLRVLYKDQLPILQIMWKWSLLVLRIRQNTWLYHVKNMSS